MQTSLSNATLDSIADAALAGGGTAFARTGQNFSGASAVGENAGTATPKGLDPSKVMSRDELAAFQKRSLELLAAAARPTMDPI